MISDEKMTHIVHLILKGLEGEYIDIHKLEEATHGCRKEGFIFIRYLEEAHKQARQKITSLKKPPLEFTVEWNTLFKKYLDEELKKKIGV